MLIAANKTGVAASFKYDPFSRLIERTVNTNKTRYVYAGSRLLEEYDSNTNTLLKRYVYAGADEAVIEMDAVGNVTYLHQDHQNSLIARANGAGTLTAKYEYSPWGETSLPGTGFGYTGQRWDADLGLYNYKARYYDPAKGRFLQPDPIGYKQDMNLYTYCVNDPVNMVDPDGEEPRKPTSDPNFRTYGEDHGGIDWKFDFRPVRMSADGPSASGIPGMQAREVVSRGAKSFAKHASSTSGENQYAAAGRGWDKNSVAPTRPRLPASMEKQPRLPSGKRPDFLDRESGTIIEDKPGGSDWRRNVRRGATQIETYAEDLRKGGVELVNKIVRLHWAGSKWKNNEIFEGQIIRK